MSGIEKRIRFFNMVRDIPYYISTGKEQDYSCATKPLMLDVLLSSLGLKVRHILCEFRWSKIGLPKELLKIPHDDLETHEYLEIWIPEKEKWVKVDPTWDSRIKHLTIKINKWNGLSDTKLTVPVHKTWSPQESKRHIEKLNNMPEAERNEILKRNGKFYAAFNRWLDYARKPI